MNKISAPNFVGEAIDTGMNSKLRRIYVFGEIDNDMAHKFVASMDALNAAGSGRITIVLNSIGGSVYDGFAIYDAIKHSRSLTDVVVTGQCFSMAAIILQAATFRSALPSAAFMTHDGTDKFDGHTRDFEAWAAEAKRVRHYMYAILGYRTAKDHKYWARRGAVDKIFTADDALAIGLIDEVLE